jgi:hypothetical protein
MKKTNWDTSRDRDDVEAFAEKCNRFRELEPNPIDDLIMERIVELASEQDRLLRMQRLLAGIWGSRAENDVNNDQRLTRGERYGKAWSAMTIQERFRIAERVAQDWEDFR